VDTLVDPVELLSSSHMRAAPRSGESARSAPRAGVTDGHREPHRASFPSIDPEAQVQWFSRAAFDEEPVSTVDVEISWDEECETEPTLVLRHRVKGVT
jgi:hypothetical protein